MDKRLQVTDGPREVASGVRAETPLVTIAWRALRAEHQQRADERRRIEKEAQQIQEVLATVAVEVHRLQRGAVDAQQLAPIAERITEALAMGGVSVIAPEGEPFTPDLMELLENVAQRPLPGVDEPRVGEVITPAVLCRGGLVRRGKAVIEIPVGQSE